MKKLLVVLMAALCLTACATTESPMSITAKGLLSGRLAVIGMAETSDALCQKGVLKQPDCDTAKDTYQKAQVAYKTGSDALLAWVATGVDGGNTAQSSLATVNSLVGNMQSVVNTFIQPQGGK